MTLEQFSKLPSTTQVMFILATSIGLSISHHSRHQLEEAMSKGILEGLILVEKIQSEKKNSAGVNLLLGKRVSRIPEDAYIPDEVDIRKRLEELIREKNNEVLKEA